MSEIESITPSLAGEAWLKMIKYPQYNRRVRVQTWEQIGRASRAGVFDVDGRTDPTATTGRRGGRQFNLIIIMDDVLDPTLDPIAEASNMDLRLTLDEVWFIHVPPERGVPGGYVVFGQTGEDRHPRAGDDATRTFALPCTSVTPPGPDVVGTTITVAGLIALHGTVEAVAATYPSVRELLNTIGSLDDPVVIG